MIASLPPVHLTGSSPEHVMSYHLWVLGCKPRAWSAPLRPGGDGGVAHVEREPASGVIASAAPLRRPSTRILVNTEAVASPKSFSSSKAYSHLVRRRQQHASCGAEPVVEMDRPWSSGRGR